MSLFVIKLIIVGIGFCLALVNFVRYMERKDKAKLRWAAIFFFGSWLVLVVMKVVEVVFKLN
jgi:hypothetical protein